MSEPRIQLWTDDNGIEFAILFNSSYVIRTNEFSEYTKKIDESVCMQGYTYDWKHTLSQWVHYLYGNQIVLNIAYISTGQISEPEPVLGTQVQQQVKRVRHHLSYYKPEKSVKQRKKIKAKNYVLSCHFCNLKYCLEVERTEHEKFWHSV